MRLGSGGYSGGRSSRRRPRGARPPWHPYQQGAPRPRRLDVVIDRGVDEVITRAASLDLLRATMGPSPLIPECVRAS